MRIYLLLKTPRHSLASLRSLKVGSETIHFMNIVEREIPIAPAWCLTEDRLTIAFYPQAIKGMLSIDSAERRLPEVPEVASQLKSSAPLLGLTYLDTRALFRTFYPAAQIGVQMAASEWKREGIDLDISILPPARTIERHLQPSTMAFTRATDGLEFTSHQSLPGGSMAGVVPVLLGAGLPAVRSARSTARTTQDMNTLKQFILALHMYQAEKDSFPAAQRNIENDKGLSWRVELLPYLGHMALYKEFHHDEPWNSEHNLSLIKKMPPEFRSASNSGSHAVAVAQAKEVPKGEVDEGMYAAFRTPFVVIRHKDSVFPPGAEKGTKFKDITGGGSNTIAVVVANPEASVIWTKPEDINFEPAKPFAGLRQSWWLLSGRFL